MNLNYEEFKEKIKDDIKDYMDEKYKDCGVVIRKVNKTNREVDGLNFYDIPGLKNATPTIYVNNLYEEYERTGKYEEVIRIAAETMERGIKSFNDEIKAELLDTSRLKDNVFFTLINAEQNREILKTVHIGSLRTLQLCIDGILEMILWEHIQILLTMIWQRRKVLRKMICTMQQTKTQRNYSLY